MVHLAVLIQFRRVTDGRTDGLTTRAVVYTALCIYVAYALRAKNAFRVIAFGYCVSYIAVMVRHLAIT